MIYGFSIDEKESGIYWNFIYFKQMEYDFGIRTLRSLITSQDLAITKIRDDFQKEMDEDKVLNSLDPYNGSMHYEHFYSDQENMIEEIEVLQRYSMCVSCFSFFESRLKELCERIESNFELDIKIEDLNRKSDILRYWIFLTKVFKIPVTAEELFTSINNKKDVRNVIVHQNGIPKTNQVGKIKNIKGIKLSESKGQNRIVMIGSQFNKEFLVEIEMFFSELVKAVDERYREMELV